jgi:hypothetical protein
VVLLAPEIGYAMPMLTAVADVVRGELSGATTLVNVHDFARPTSG